MTVDEEVIREALARSAPGDLEAVLKTVEAYRSCVRAADRLVGQVGMGEWRDQALECAGSCWKALAQYAERGHGGGSRQDDAGEARFVFAVRC